MKKEAYEALREELHTRILSQIDLTREVRDEEILDLIDSEIVERTGGVDVFPEERRSLRRELFYAIRKLDILQELLDDPEITEIMINGSDNIFIEKHGAIVRYPQHFASAEKLGDVIQQIVSACNRVVNAGSPIADARLPGGERVNIVLPPAAINGPIVTIRRFPDKPITMRDLIGFGSISEEVASFLTCLVKAGYNIFISGGTGSGKTTFLGALADFIPSDERVITIEDNAELQIRHIPNLVKLEARDATVEGSRAITIRDLIRTSLRMRPDRIIVGEVRGGEAVDMLQAMNTGHDGSMSTGHANSAADMLARLETMGLSSDMDLPLSALRGQIASGIDVIVHLGRLRDRTRKLLEVDELRGIKDGRIQIAPLYTFEETGETDGRVLGTWRKRDDLAGQEKLRSSGVTLPAGPADPA